MVSEQARDYAIGTIWGFAEATLFFIVPDVWLGRIALTSLKRALVATVATLAGAVLGGVLVAMVCAHISPTTSMRVMDAIPAIAPLMIQQVDAEVGEHGSRAIMDGPVRGIPYKPYARSVGVMGGPDAGFVGWSILGRAYRWIIILPLIRLLSYLAERFLHLSPRQSGVVYVVGWSLFYAYYLTSVPWS